MHFNVGIKSFSISKQAKKVFEELEEIRPKHISFSLMLAIVADEYIKQHKKGLTKLDDFDTEEVTSKIPHVFGNISNWDSYISSIDDDEFKNFQSRLSALQNIIDRRCNL
jgi:hypothetical protein